MFQNSMQEPQEQGNTQKQGWYTGLALTVPLLLVHLTPVFPHRQDVLEQNTAVVLAVRPTAERTLQDLHHMGQQLSTL